MTTESSVLEKLKRYIEMETRGDCWSEEDEVIAPWCKLSEEVNREIIPKIIAALELVEEKAKEEPWIDYRQGRHPGEIWKLGVDNGEINFAREIVACLQAQHPEGAPMAVLEDKK